MKNKINSILDKLNFIIIVGLIVLVPITFFINYFSIFHFHSNFTFKIHQVLTFILPIEIFIHFYKLFTKQKRIDYFDFLIYLLILFGIISAIFAEDFQLALWGSIYRFEGLIQICCYYMLFLNSRLISNKKDLIIKVINTLIIIGLIQVVYSFLQVFVRGEFIYVKYEFVYYRPSGFIGHPNMLGSYIVLTLLSSLGMYLLYDKKKIFYLVSSILLYINLVLSQSTGPYFGFLLGLLFMIIFLIIKKKVTIQKSLIIGISIITVLLSVSCISKYWCENKFHDRYLSYFTITGDIVDTINSFGKAASSNSNDELLNLEQYGSNRIWLWKKTLKLVPNNWLHGVGIDNFMKSFKALLTEEELSSHLGRASFDRAHNEYLQLLVTQGVPALIAYLTLLFLVFLKGIKSKDLLCWILMFGFVGYAVQAFTNISVYNVAPFFFIVMGLLVGLSEYDLDSKSV